MNHHYKLITLDNTGVKAWREEEPELYIAGKRSFTTLKDVQEEKDSQYKYQKWLSSAKVFTYANDSEKNKIHKRIMNDTNKNEVIWGYDITSFCEIREEERCANRCDWPNCTFKDCMEKHPDEWVKGKTFYAYFKEDKPCTHEVVKYAMKAVSHEVRSPKCVRDGSVKEPVREEETESQEWNLICLTSLIKANVEPEDILKQFTIKRK